MPDQALRDLMNPTGNALLKIAWASKEDQDEFIKKIVFVHLTEQQRLTALLYRVIEAINAHPYTDLRNTEAKAFARKVVEAVGEAYFPMI
jgi:hypothetical protein